MLAPATALVVGLVTHRRDTALAAAILVLLHTPADLVTGYKFLWAGIPLVGMELYEYPVADFVLEAATIVTAWWWLKRSRPDARWAIACIALAALILVQAGFNAARSLGEKGKPTGCTASEFVPNPRSRTR